MLDPDRGLERQADREDRGEKERIARRAQRLRSRALPPRQRIGIDDEAGAVEAMMLQELARRYGVRRRVGARRDRLRQEHGAVEERADRDHEAEREPSPAVRHAAILRTLRSR